MSELIMEVEFYPNKNMAAIHINRVVPSISGYSSDKIDAGFQSLFDSLNSIDGVIRVSSGDKYEISFQKGHVFSWDEIIPKAMSLIEQHFDHEPLLLISHSYTGE
jgi:hypothetical protein